MSFIAKNPDKAKYRIDSVTTDSRKMKELCDNTKQIAEYVTKITGEARTGIRVWKSIPTPKVKANKAAKPAKKA